MTFVRFGFIVTGHGEERFLPKRERIVERLDLERVLADPQRCAALRTMFAWCAQALGSSGEERLRFLEGALCPVTRGQLAG